MNQKEKVLVVDIETESLDPKIIWCCVCKELTTNKYHYFTNLDEQYDKLQQLFDDADIIVGHNFIGFDAPALRKIWNITIPNEKIVDTLILSRLADSSRQSHSLEDWGKELGSKKIEHEDWSKLSREMLIYCKQDVNLTGILYNFLITNKLKNFSSISIETELQTQRYLQEMKEDGFYLNKRMTLLAIQHMKRVSQSLEDSIVKFFPPSKFLIRENWSPRLKKDGTLFATDAKILANYEHEKLQENTFNVYDYKEFNIGSSTQIVERLQPYWKPYKLTDKGTPQVCEQNLETIDKDAPKELRNFSLWKMIDNRISMLSSYIEALGDDGRVHGTVNSIGTITHRMSHKNPNTGNIASVRKRFGSICRSVFTVEDTNTRCLIGCDADQIQLRVLAHYMADPAYIAKIEEGDIHTYNQQLAKLPTRAQAKTFIYSLLMGAGFAKLGTLVGGTAKDGKDLYNTFISGLPAFKKLKDNLERAANRGWMKALDGRWVPIKNAHFAMSSLLQSGETVIMKRALCLQQKWIKEKQLDSILVAIVHDEFQRDTLKTDSELTGKLMAASIAKAGENYKTVCPMSGGYKIGRNWYETH